MTITYTLDVATTSLVGIVRLIFRWKGSIWKTILPEMCIWSVLYAILSICYRYFMNREQRIVFEDICVFFYTYSDYIPITFMLGFYVSAVFGRWNQIFDNLGWIDSPGLLIATYVRGKSEEARNIRRNIVRYMILVQAFVFRDISTSVKKRFPTMDHFVTAGLMTTNELKEFDSISSQHFKYWTPIQWAFLLLRRARDKNMIESDIIYVDMLEKIRVFRLQVLTLTLYDWVPIPLVYTQVVNMAVRAYFLIALFGRQYLSLTERELDTAKGIDLYIPIMTLMQFLFYMGWTKVAEMMLNPLGEDDDDFETNWIIDRNLQVGFSIVDDGYGRVPDLEHDMFWEEAIPEPLYTAESASRPHNPMIGSCNDIAEQQDALLAQPRRRRLMSTATMFDSSFIKRDPENDDANVVPVQNHNPSRRMSIASPHPFADSGHQGIFDTVRRKFSRSIVRHDSVLPSYDSSFEKSLPANGGFGPHKPPPLRTRSLNRNLPSNSPPTNRDAPAFSQSLNITRTQPTPLDSSTLSLHNQDIHENGNTGPGVPDRPREHSGNWQYNEMLPIIEEVQERLRRNQRDSITESILTESASNSSPKNSIHNNAESSRKVSPAAEVKGEKAESSDKTAGEVSSEIQPPETALSITEELPECPILQAIKESINETSGEILASPEVRPDGESGNETIKKPSVHSKVSISQRILERQYSTASSSSSSSSEKKNK